MDTELEAMTTWLDRVHFSEADRHLAQAEMERAEAFAELVHKAVAATIRLLRGHSVQAPHGPDVGAPASS